MRTASGAIAVQVVRKHRGRREILEHVGSAHTDAELGVLLEEARGLALAGQGALDFDVPEPVARIEDVADWHTGQLPVPQPQETQVAATGRTQRTTARLLYDTLAAVYHQLGFDIVDDPVFKNLVVARIVEPTSKADTQRVLNDLGVEPGRCRTRQFNGTWQ